MGDATSFNDTEHPLDVFETLADSRQWPFQRVSDEQVFMDIDGNRQKYSVTLIWSAAEQTLKLICEYELHSDTRIIPAFYESLNAVNSRCSCGAFTYEAADNSLIYTHNLPITCSGTVTEDQIAFMVTAAVSYHERYYYVFQLTLSGEHSPHEAITLVTQGWYGYA